VASCSGVFRILERGAIRRRGGVRGVSGGGLCPLPRKKFDFLRPQMIILGAF